MTLQLEVGKKYLNRRGEVVEIVYDWGEGCLYRWNDGDQHDYTDDGRYWYGEEDPDDLISEYFEPSTEPASTTNKVPHPHADVIIAWASGEAIEYLDEEDGEFYYTDKPSWDVDTVYRIKPEKKVEVFVDENAALIYRSKGGVVYVIEDSNIQLTVEDGKLIKAEVL